MSDRTLARLTSRVTQFMHLVVVVVVVVVEANTTTLCDPICVVFVMLQFICVQRYCRYALSLSLSRQLCDYEMNVKVSSDDCGFWPTRHKYRKLHK